MSHKTWRGQIRINDGKVNGILKRYAFCLLKSKLLSRALPSLTWGGEQWA